LYLLSESVYVAAASAMAGFIFIETVNTGLFIPLGQGQFWLLIPLILGLITFFRFSKRHGWLFNYPTAVIFGFSLGIALTSTLQTWIVSPLSDVLTRTTNLAPDPVSAIIVFIATITSVIYFLYSSKLSGPFYEGKLSWLSKLGRIFIAIGIGYLLGKVEVVEATDWALGSFWFSVIKRMVDTLKALLG